MHLAFISTKAGLRQEQPANNVSQHPSDRHDQEQAAPAESVRRAGHAATRKPGTSRVRRATGPLRYSPSPGAAACRVLPATPLALLRARAVCDLEYVEQPRGLFRRLRRIGESQER